MSYTFISQDGNKRVYALATNRKQVLRTAVSQGTAGLRRQPVEILRGNVKLTKDRMINPVDATDSSAATLVTNMVNIEVSGAFSDTAELTVHINEAVRCFLKNWSDYRMKDGLPTPIQADFAE